MPNSSFPALPTSLRASLEGEVAVLRLSRPDKRNALNDEAVHGLETFFRGLPDAVKAVVLHGEGDHFSAGLDLSELKERDAAQGIVHSAMWHRVFQLIEFGKVPVIAAMHGAVVGGGLELACATHIRVAERSVFYALPEGQRGIFVGGGGSVRLPKLVGVARVMDMMMTGRTYGAEEGVQLGFSQYVVDKGAGLAKAMELGRKAASNTAMTNFAIMHALPRIAGADPATGFLTESLMSAIAQDTREAKARLADFLEKRAEKVRHE